MTFDDLLSELRTNEDDDTSTLYKYDYNKFFKIYSRLAWNDIPILPGDFETTHFVQSVIECGEDLIIKIIQQRMNNNSIIITTSKVVTPMTAVAYLVRATNSFDRHESNGHTCGSSSMRNEVSEPQVEQLEEETSISSSSRKRSYDTLDNDDSDNNNGVHVIEEESDGGGSNGGGDGDDDGDEYKCVKFNPQLV